MQFPGPVSLSAFAVQIWELAIHWSDEVEYLWKGRINSVKSLYFASRYGLLIAQITSEVMSYQVGHATHADCTSVFMLRILLAQITLTMVEIILLIRVYALYSQGRHAKLVFGAVFAVSFALESTATARMLVRLVNGVDCKPPVVEKSIFIQFGLGAGSFQFIIFILSMNGLLLRRGSRTPLTALMLKEGVVAFLLIVALLVVMMVHYELFRTFDRGIGQAAFAWYITLISAGASRLILNMRRLTVKSMRRRQMRQQSACRTIGSEEPGYMLYDSDDEVYLTSFYE
ncbi:hypothetical protein HYPSUDRAFT_45042 [Hypholoma sublateritium FD-334 SS-4]|uniref:DUF6533 domain-containing protein n=1 Tax=Hypholoma sublateritium (strain FD-334 SS-4) TaxID=945553 RepID=A0A0D2PEW3_HYPSF|nr:hypothetical protein HYPSUDRAFT_45042 [Hypholoma sublateritium FD-334 SS-4]